MKSLKRNVAEKVHTKNKDRGRSMLEVIGVLAVMVLLTFGATFFYQQIVVSAKVNNEAKQIAALAISHRIDLKHQKKGEYSNEDIKGAHAPLHLEDMSAEEGKETSLSKYFKIVVSGTDKLFCEKLISSPLIGADLITLDGNLNGVCPAEEIAFYFRKDTSSKHALTYTDAEDMTIKLCPEGAVCQEDINDFECADGYYRNENKCPECPEHVETCDKDGFKCELGYYQEGDKCVKCRGIVDEDRTECNSCPEGQKPNEDNTSCVDCVVGDTDCGCPPDKPNVDGEGNCVQCTTANECKTLYPDLYENTFACSEDHKCETQKECSGATPVYSNGHCCPLAKPYWNETECIRRDDYFEGMDGYSYLCSVNRLILVTGVEANCAVCENREVQLHNGNTYCVPKCEGGFLNRSTTESQPTVTCIPCGQNTGFMVGPISCAACACAERECYALGFDGNNQCQLKNCPSGTFGGQHGCPSCDTLDSVNMTQWYNGGGVLRHNTEVECTSCMGKYGPRLMTTGGYHFCYLETCPSGSFRNSNGRDCTWCTSDKSIAASKAECDKCVDASGNHTRHYERGYCMKGNTCANGVAYNSETGCGNCDEGYFWVAGKCVPCSSDAMYTAATDATECARCNGLRVMHYVHTTGTTCMLKAVVGERYYSSEGTKACDSNATGVVYERFGDCLDYCPNRIVGREYNCMRDCDPGFFLGTASWSSSWSCRSCDDENVYAMESITRKIDDQYVTTTPKCSEVCPGRRFSRGGYCLKCHGEARLENETECTSCNGTWDPTSETCLLPQPDSEE